jgi:uncharacterized membrane protein YdbT with pleckstrin-like domain
MQPKVALLMWPTREGRNVMSYLDRNLMNGELIVYRSRLHWVVFLWPIIFFATAIMSTIIISGAEGFIIGFMSMSVSIFWSICSFITYKTSEFGITNKRIIVKVGFIRRNSLEALLNKVEDIQVNQSIFGKMLGFGSITVSGTGGTKDPFHRIGAPLEFRKKAQEQIASFLDSK